ncbi:MAG TPA: hypothetical protein VF989_17735 [Polyangiaceae bacterium]
MTARFANVALPAALAALSGCGDATSMSDPSAFIGAEVGFFELEAVEYSIGEPREAFVAAPARLFYVFAPADEPTRDTPLCLLFNGGPGVGSELVLEGLGPRLPGAGAGPNPASLTRLCHALFVDARNTGLSYVVADETAPHDFGWSNYNAFIDGADYLRVLLRFIDARPELRDAPVIVVGESFGGVRATALLNLLLYAEAYAAGARPYADPALDLELRAYSSDWLGPLTPSALGVRFGHQVLIQPSIASGLQDSITGSLMAEPDSIVSELGRERGQEFSPCPADQASCDPYLRMVQFMSRIDVSPYDYRAPWSWLSNLLAAHTARVADIAKFESLIGARLTSVFGLASEGRGAALRLPSAGTEAADATTWVELLGGLAETDRYFVMFNTAVYDAFFASSAAEHHVDFRSELLGELFLQNLTHTETFITRASYDLVNYSPALIEALGALTGVGSATLDVSRPSVERPGEIVIEYESGRMSSRIRAPEYAASHTVSDSEGGALAADVIEWWGRLSRPAE